MSLVETHNLISPNPADPSCLYARSASSDEGVQLRRGPDTGFLIPPLRCSSNAKFTVCAVRTNGTSASLYGLSLGNANANSNWLAFMARMGINYGRLFVATNVDLRKTLGSNFGAESVASNTAAVKVEELSSLFTATMRMTVICTQ